MLKKAIFFADTGMAADPAGEFQSLARQNLCTDPAGIVRTGAYLASVGINLCASA